MAEKHLTRAVDVELDVARESGGAESSQRLP